MAAAGAGAMGAFGGAGAAGAEGLGGAEFLSGIDLGGAGASPASWLGSEAASGAGLSGLDLGGAGGSPGSMGGSYADAIGADNIDIGGGWNPATGMGDAATAAGAEATGLTSSAANAYGLPSGGLSGLSNLSKLLGSNKSSGTSLTGMGALAGLGGLAGAMALINADKGKYGVPGKQAYTGPMNQFKYNPALFTPTRVDPNMFKPQGAPTARVGYAAGGQIAFANGGVSDLGGYSDGGRMLKGPGDGMSDSIPASISGKQPARLADSEFVIPADVVSHLGNGSSDAGAKVLYKMMDRIRQARTGNKDQGKQINPSKYMPK
jgi:hypothetical protein